MSLERIYADKKSGEAVGRSQRALSLLMVLTLLALTAFLSYWLKQNYDREQRMLTIKTDLAFRQSILRLQAGKLKLDGISFNDSTGRPSVKVFMSDDASGQLANGLPRQEIVSTINVIRDKAMDTLKKGTTRMVISMNNNTIGVRHDSLTASVMPSPIPGEGKDNVFRLLYGVDSLQDSLRVREIDSAVAAVFRKENMRISFTVIRLDSAVRGGEPVLNQATVGFARPVTYRLRAGNTTGYLLLRIAQPILFSVLLLGITVLSFVLLYRSLMRQRRLAELKHEFISNITHELKTPIATVGVAIEALKNFNALQDPEKTREYLDISSQELQRLGLLVDKVLKLSLFEKSGLELHPEPLNLQELVNEVVSSLRLQWEKRHAQVTVTANGDTRLTADRLHLLSVIFNLLDNALKYSTDNPAIAIQLTGGETEIVMQVSDNGIGIPPEYQERVFDKFFRVPHGDTHNAKGYGLGLSYVAQVVKKHRGTIRVESSTGKGSAFIITLPKSFEA